ncbi:MAG TPA: hypothetical protein VF546_15085 [Pyrinomonadaceae bacterium]|jgi:hypothetical protein
MKLLVLLVVLVGSAPGVRAEGLVEIAGRVKGAVEEKRSCWKLNRVQERWEGTAFEQEWLCGKKEAVTIYYFQRASVEEAAKLFEEIRTSPVQAPGRYVDAPKVGDQSTISAYNEYSTSSYVFFRKGDVVVRIDSNLLARGTPATTLENAVRFAQLVEAQIASPASPPGQTRN